MTDNFTGFSRRNIITGAAALGISAIANKKADAEVPAVNSSSPDLLAREESISQTGSYQKVPLIKPAIRLSIVQSRVRGVVLDRLKQTRQDNLNQ